MQRPTEVDCIREIQRVTGTHLWGWVIYRGTYVSQESWNKFIAIFKNLTREFLDNEDALDLEDTLRWTIIENAEELDNATVKEIASRFRQWKLTDGQQEQSQSVPAEDEDSTRSRYKQVGATLGENARYNYCIYVDEEALQSVLTNPEEGYFILINDFEANGPDASTIVYSGSSFEIDQDQLEEVYWARAELRFWVGVFAFLMDLNAWYCFRVEPPEISEH